jgi:hypothetical protein
MSTLSLRSRQLLATVGGIVIGVLLVATGWAPAQLAGAAVIGGGLLLARGGVRFAEAWLSDPAGQAVQSWRRAQRAAPAWAWQATVAALLLVALAVMVIELLTSGDIDSGTAGDFGKGAIALAMMGSLVFWSANGIAWRPKRRAKSAPSSTDRRNGRAARG